MRGGKGCDGRGGLRGAERLLTPRSNRGEQTGATITMPHFCERCGQQGELSSGEKPGSSLDGRGRGDHMDHWASFHCHACGSAYEEDGQGIPDTLRDAITARDGEWVLEVLIPPSVSLLKALREIGALSLPELQALRAQLPGILLQGTECEVRWERALLERHGATDALEIRKC